MFQTTNQICIERSTVSASTDVLIVLVLGHLFGVLSRRVVPKKKNAQAKIKKDGYPTVNSHRPWQSLADRGWKTSFH